MSIQVQRDRCIGCGACKSICPGNLLAMDASGKAYIKRPSDCWGCTSCIKECHQEAILFYLGADMGGQGAVLTTTQTSEGRTWNIRKPDGELHCIHVNAKQSNRY